MDDALLVTAQAAKCGNSALTVRGSGTGRLVSSDIIIYSSIFRHLSQPACDPGRALNEHARNRSCVADCRQN
jgi:hypothetical protein